MKDKIAYHRMTMKVIEDNRKIGVKPSLLLHCCCAPCATVPLVDWAVDFDVTAFYYNPNIFPEEEAQVRAKELERFVKTYPFAERPQVVIGEYVPEFYLEKVRGLEQEPERGKRCAICFEMRLEQSAKLAKEQGFDYFTTTLSISPHKDAALLHRLGLEAQERWGVQYLPCDLKKGEGMKRSVALSKEFSLYRQEYCGCVFSRNEKLARDRQHNEEKNDETDII
jgi:hypothetical protein